MRKIIIDTDPGVDDAMALMLAIKSGQFDIKAITTVCGNSTIENTTRNARYILDLLGTNGIPLLSGAEKPLKRPLKKAVVHGQNGLGGIYLKNKVFLTADAVENIIQLVKDNPHEVTIVALGPLTNIALAIKQNPQVMSRVKEIIMMGGAIKVCGNQNRVAEFNMFVDPEAAKIVFDYKVKKTLVPLDVCNKVQLSFDDFKKIVRKSISKPLLQMVKPYISSIEKDTGIKAALMYDPLTIFYLISPESCITRNYNIKIETKGEFTRGMTVADLRTVKDNLDDNCTVVEEIPSKEFCGYFIDTFNK